jgi:Fe-S-cluster containining protein
LEECEKCGKCCKKYIGTIPATEDDITRWKKEKRYDILSYVCFMPGNKWGDLFFNPKTGEEIYNRCPFLRKITNQNIYKCRIYDTRPDVCINYSADTCLNHK